MTTLESTDEPEGIMVTSLSSLLIVKCGKIFPITCVVVNVFDLSLFHNPQRHKPEGCNSPMQKFQNSKTLSEEVRGLMGLSWLMVLEGWSDPGVLGKHDCIEVSL